MKLTLTKEDIEDAILENIFCRTGMKLKIDEVDMKFVDKNQYFLSVEEAIVEINR